MYLEVGANTAIRTRPRPFPNLDLPHVKPEVNHRANIMKKLNLSKTAEIVKYAVLKGYTTLTA